MNRIHAGHKYIKLLGLSDDAKAILRANFIEHQQSGRADFVVKESVFRDVPEVAAVLGLPLFGAPLKTPERIFGGTR
jgi:hypothetical protein